MPRKTRITFISLSFLCLCAAKEGPLPSALAPLLACRDISDGPARLACYDGKVDGLKGATDRNEMIVMDRSQVQQARRSVFGLMLPSLSFLDRDPNGAPKELEEINATISAARQLPYGKWTFVLDDGARWTQTEPGEFPRDPKAGMPVVIRKAAMGSFLAKIDGQRAIRVQRDR